jgi:hypothetical protein
MPTKRRNPGKAARMARQAASQLERELHQHLADFVRSKKGSRSYYAVRNRRRRSRG